jgi:hypothetical protein
MPFLWHCLFGPGLASLQKTMYFSRSVYSDLGESSQVIVYDRHTVRKIASTRVVQRARNMGKNTSMSHTYYMQSAHAWTWARRAKRDPQSYHKHGQLYTRQLLSAIVDPTQNRREVLSKEGSVFPLQRENPLPTYCHLECEKGDLTFRSHHQEWLRPNVSVSAIFLSPTERKFTIALEKANKEPSSFCGKQKEPIKDVKSLFLCSLSCQTQDKEWRTKFVVPCLGSSLNPILHWNWIVEQKKVIISSHNPKLRTTTSTTIKYHTLFNSFLLRIRLSHKIKSCETLRANWSNWP